MRSDPEFTACYPETLSVRVTVVLGEGQPLVERVDRPKGHSRRALSDREVEEKFKRFATPRLGEVRTTSALQKLWNPEKLQDMRDLMDAFVILA